MVRSVVCTVYNVMQASRLIIESNQKRRVASGSRRLRVVCSYSVVIANVASAAVMRAADVCTSHVGIASDVDIVAVQSSNTANVIGMS